MSSPGRLLATLACVLWVGSFLARSDGAEKQLRYVRKATRQETIEATLEATGWPRPVGPWYFLGPFDNVAGTGFRTEYPPERDWPPDLKRSYRGRGGEIVRWRKAVRVLDNEVNNLQLYSGIENSCVYLYRRMVSPRRALVTASFGSDDTITVWVNGYKVLARDVQRAVAPDQEQVQLPLNKGVNHLLVKICNYGGPMGFYFALRLPPRLEAELQRRLEEDFPADPESQYYRIYTIPVPEDIVLEVGGLVVRPDGKLLVCTRRGEIWLVENPDAEDLSEVRFRLFARGLHEPLGMTLVGNDLYVCQRPELTLVRDVDGDDRADEFITVCDWWGLSGDYHEFAFGPARTPDGSFFVALNVGFQWGHQAKAPWRGWCVRITPDGKFVPWASGLRSPNTIAVAPDGTVFYCDNQGEWVAACKLVEVRQGEFYGHAASLRWHPTRREEDIPLKGQRYDALDPKVGVTPPAVWFPYAALSQSASEPVWDETGGRFGPFAGQCFVGEQTKSLIMRVDLERVRGRYQGACFAFRSGFQCGVNRLAFAPDGTLYVGQTDRGWGSVGGKSYGLQRVVFTGKVPFEIKHFRIQQDAIAQTFTKPVDRETAANTESYALESYTYHYWSTYGSPEIDRRPVRIERAVVDADGLRVRLVVPVEELRTGRVYQLTASGVRSRQGEPLLHPEGFYTLNQLPEPAATAAGQ